METKRAIVESTFTFKLLHHIGFCFLSILNCCSKREVPHDEKLMAKHPND
jgi:hypothetical protein